MTEATRWAGRPAPEGYLDESPGHRARPLEESSEETPEPSVPDTKSPPTNDLEERREACHRWRSRLKPAQVVHLRDLLIKKDKDTIAYKLSKLDKGEDETISISELLKTNPNRVDGSPHN